MRLLWDLFPFIFVLAVLVVIFASPDWLNSLVSRRVDYEKTGPGVQQSVPFGPKGQQDTMLNELFGRADSADLRKLDSIMTAQAIERATRDAGK
jgi:hypothetical protein